MSDPHDEAQINPEGHNAHYGEDACLRPVDLDGKKPLALARCSDLSTHTRSLVGGRSRLRVSAGFSPASPGHRVRRGIQLCYAL